MTNLCDQNAGREGHSDHLYPFFLRAAATGILFKENASISGTEANFRAKSVAASIAALEIAMERHRGMTCDLIGSPAQIPWIARNAVDAVKALNACRTAIDEAGGRSRHATSPQGHVSGLALAAIEC